MDYKLFLNRFILSIDGSLISTTTHVRLNKEIISKQSKLHALQSSRT